MFGSKQLSRVVLVVALGCYWFGGLKPTAADSVPPTDIHVAGEIDLSVPTITLSNLTALESIGVQDQINGLQTFYFVYPLTPVVNGTTTSWSFDDTALPDILQLESLRYLGHGILRVHVGLHGFCDCGERDNDVCGRFKEVAPRPLVFWLRGVGRRHAFRPDYHREPRMAPPPVLPHLHATQPE